MLGAAGKPEAHKTFVKALYCVIAPLPAIAASPLPYYVDGVNACPTADVGGVSDYKDFLQFMTDPKHSGYDDVVG
ncbi:hypothetical protein [Pseudomonas sp. 008]|uniref:IS1096 element passenger TnpR family protein n=1 Tax=unclassified Pseudomonas TaxID=196821 RepID=UPI001A554CD2|nr:hypothetical protein [Pseudomonas sp. 008]GID05224.1 hypothetical protein TMM008_24260 [Pseudomonas sp. 008]